MAPHIFSELRMREVSKYHQYGDRGRFKPEYEPELSLSQAEPDLSLS